MSKQSPFLLIPSQGTIAANKKYTVNIVFQPDHESNDYFAVLLIDIPNQINEKKVYLRGQAYHRQFFVREYDPFIWKDNDVLRKKYEEPLKMLNYKESASPSSGTYSKQRILLEFARDDDIAMIENEYEKAKNRVREVLIGNCKLLDNKMEKAGNYEITPPAGENKYFECDNLKGTLQAGQE